MKINSKFARLRARGESERGFTLIELIIVIAIIGILVAIAIPVYGTIQDNARDKMLKSVAKKALTSATAAVGDNDPNTTTATAFAALTNSKVRVYFFNGDVNNQVDGTPTPYSEELFCVRADIQGTLAYGIHTGPGCDKPGIDIPAANRF